jgi:hypothetical protein
VEVVPEAADRKLGFTFNRQSTGEGVMMMMLTDVTIIPVRLESR